MYETAVVSATEKCSLGAKIPKMSLQAYDSSGTGVGLIVTRSLLRPVETASDC